MKNLVPFQEQFERELETYRNKLPKTPLFEPIAYILSLGGKRIRPTLVMLAGKAFGADDARLIPAAIAVEVFHNFSLVHDDIMDEAPLRRGAETVHAKWNENTGILSGDAMLIEAYRLLANSDRDKLGALMDLFNTTSMEVCEGQQLDMDFESMSNVAIASYIEMIRQKTAVLLGCSLKMGAILGGASEKDAQGLYEFGKLAGIGFQIQDDFLDAFGDPSQFGKQVGGDILANKKTYLTITALELAQGDLKKELQEIVSTNGVANPEAKIARVLEIYRELKVDTITQKEIDKYFDQARIELSKVEISTNYVDGFVEFLEALQVRNR